MVLQESAVFSKIEPSYELASTQDPDAVAALDESGPLLEDELFATTKSREVDFETSRWPTRRQLLSIDTVPSNQVWVFVTCVVFALAFALLFVQRYSEPRMVHHVYNEAEASLFMQYARASFCSKEALQDWNCGDICESVPVDPSSVRFLNPGTNFNVQGYVAALREEGSTSGKGTRCIIAFRGSVNVENWEGDALFFPERWPPQDNGQVTSCDLPGAHRCTPLKGADYDWCPGCKVHMGFGAAYSDLRPQLFRAVLDLGCGDVALTGHSLGAAVATLATLELRVVMGFQASPVFLFGAPRVGNQEFVSVFRHAAKVKGVEPPAWRIVHFKDPIPRIVPRIKPFEYQHFPVEVYYPSEAQDVYRVCDPNDGEDPTCMDAIGFPECVLSLDHLNYLNMSLRGEDQPDPCTSQGRRMRIIGKRTILHISLFLQRVKL